MLKKLVIENFKSIHEETIELGKVNVFIGENGCGKTNILEAFGLASAAKEDELSIDQLIAKGIRIGRPSITLNSFLGVKQKNTIKLAVDVVAENGNSFAFNLEYTPKNIKDIWTNWDVDFELERMDKMEKTITTPFGEVSGWNNDMPEIMLREILTDLSDLKESDIEKEIGKRLPAFKKTFNYHDKQQLFKADNLKPFLSYKIFNLSTEKLRGIDNRSHALPGINGENLDLLINEFSKEELAELMDHAHFIAWLDDIILDKDDLLKYDGHKLNRSSSILYFKDKYMQKKNNIFSAENANEGVLHVLFYLALFISKRAPKFFAIDNIETALNPALCRALMEAVVRLSKKQNKQVLITTHNPAILDGLNLHDDDQRLFKVYRNKKGHTKVQRIELKPDASLNGKQLKLSEMWMRNYIGALPQNLK